ncbi:MAG TPA: serine hydrolase domain-containing protein [Candidatus Methylomirabilis sp.]|nr:serine hydrolase domain-containing protein [Candidatus Methylomirabilis sp.]
MTTPVLHEGAPEKAGMDPERVDRVRKLAAGWVERGETPSLVVLVARRGVIVLHEAFGVRRQEDTTPTLKRDSIFTIASCSKPITAAAVMCLVDDGLIGLNRPFIDYVPELDVPGVQWLDEATVADLLCHTAGIDDMELGAFIAAAAKRSPELPPAAPGQHPALGKRIHLAAGAPLARRPGTAMLYSNFGYILLGDIVRRVSGQPFWQVVRSRLFEPLGMRDSHYVLPPELRGRRVYRAPGMPGTLPIPGLHRGFDSPEFDEVDMGSAGAATTARDLAVFLQMLLNRGTYDGQRVLSVASVAAMTRHQVDTSLSWIMPLIDPATGKRIDIEFRGGGYGYGLFIVGAGDRFVANGALASLSTFGHAGYGGVCMWADPERELVGVYLSVSPRLHRDIPVGNMDLFQNAVHAAVLE